MADMDRIARLRALGGTGGRKARVEAGHEALLHDIDKERAGALGRAGRKVEAAYRAVAEAEAGLDAEPGPAAWATYRAAYAAAETALWELKVTREAVGLRQHHDLLAVYPLPPRRR